MTLRYGTWAFAALILLVFILIMIPFLIWGDAFDRALSLEGARGWMEAYGSWAWAAGMLLLVSDIVLPIPGTVVMSALGWMYGWFWGGLAAFGGSFLSGLVAYGLCRSFGRPVARWIAGDRGLQLGEALFSGPRSGWLVAFSRWTPVLPEAVACLAGLMRMPPWRFTVALACGSLPLGFSFAAIGHLGQADPSLALALSAGFPLLLWGGAAHWLARRQKRAEA